VQFLVETLFVLLIVLVLPAFPAFDRLESRAASITRGAVSIVFGTLMAMFVLAVAGSDPPRAVPHFYLTHSAAEGHSRNVVNAILVDYRALDTFGEVSVLTTAAIGVWVLIRTAGGRGQP
jgi:multicomponent Na+:H+ antiporter subunit A